MLPLGSGGLGEATSFLECDYEKIDLEIVWVGGILFCGLQSYPCIDKLLLAITMYISVLGYSSDIQCQLSQGWNTKVQGQSSYLDMNISYGTDTIRMWMASNNLSIHGYDCKPQKSIPPTQTISKSIFS